MLYVFLYFCNYEVRIFKEKNAIIYTHTYILKKDNKIMKITIRINNIRLAFMENHVFRLLMLPGNNNL